MRYISKLLEEASTTYYNGNPIMSDESFDSLQEQFGASQVGYQITDGTRHYSRMYSLSKRYDITPANINSNEYFVSHKLDGAAVSLLYADGSLCMGLTRGDGIVGRDITEKLSYLVPNQINQRGFVFITGEVVCSIDETNSRNVAAGILNTKNTEDFLEKLGKVDFYAYDLQSSETPETYLDILCDLSAEGFHTVQNIPNNKYPTDGFVARLISNKKYKEAGHTSNHPRGAFAIKTRKAGIETTLLNVVWQVGKSGAVSPVGIIDPVEIDGAIISRATLHNIAYIRELNLELGCTVEVVRSGDIIPRIVRRIDT